MSERGGKIWHSRPAALSVAMSAQRHIAAWLAILGLYVQLAAAGLCTAGLPVAADAAGLSSFPICHAQSGNHGSTPTPGNPVPAHQHECPFCAVHCHAAMVTAPSISVQHSTYAVSLPADPASFIVPHVARFSAGAPPRGPPALA